MGGKTSHLEVLQGSPLTMGPKRRCGPRWKCQPLQISELSRWPLSGEKGPVAAKMDQPQPKIGHRRPNEPYLRGAQRNSSR